MTSFLPWIFPLKISSDSFSFIVGIYKEIKDQLLAKLDKDDFWVQAIHPTYAYAFVDFKKYNLVNK
jgi:hypothetical protein